MTASRQALQSMLDQLDILQIEADRRAATVRAARRLNRGSALLAASVLMDSAVEHYRGSFANRAMYTPLLVSALTLAISAHGTTDRRPDVHRGRHGAAVAAAATGLAGTGFHIWNVLKRPGRLDWQNLFYGAPIGAPMAILLAGLLGAAGYATRQVTCRRAWWVSRLGGRSPRSVGLGLLGTSAEAALLHFRGAFQNKAMFAPVTLPPVGAAFLLNAAIAPKRRQRWLARVWLRLTMLMGVAGVGFHAWGIHRAMGGWRNWQQNVVDGPPLPAPPGFTGLALAGLAALGLLWEHQDADTVRIDVQKLNSAEAAMACLVMFDVTNPVERAHTMTKRQVKSEVTTIKAILSSDDDFLRTAVRTAIQSALEAEMTEALAAERSERVGSRLGYRSGFYSRSLITRVGTIELRVPRDRFGLFSTELFERYQRSERALVSALAEMYVQGVSTRKVKAVTEQLCGHSFSASSVSEMNKTLDAALTAFATRRLDEPYPYLILDARYERAREGGVIASQAALIAIAVASDGHRQVLAVDLANRESASSWRDFLLELKQRGLHSVEFVVSDDHPGLKQAIREVLPEAAWQRCYVHFLRNAMDHLPRRANDDCLQELRWIYDRREIAEVRRDLAAWLNKWNAKYARLCDWVEENIEETLTYYRLPLSHHKHMKSTNMLERLNQEIKRRTHVVRIFPSPASCLRLVRALAVETHEEWLESPRYLNMEDLREHKKQQMKVAA